MGAAGGAQNQRGGDVAASSCGGEEEVKGAGECSACQG
jgi:hypothetical protein